MEFTGAHVGLEDGALEGDLVGAFVTGCSVGLEVGVFVIEASGVEEGVAVGCALGLNERARELHINSYVITIHNCGEKRLDNMTLRY